MRSFKFYKSSSSAETVFLGSLRDYTKRPPSHNHTHLPFNIWLIAFPGRVELWDEVINVSRFFFLFSNINQINPFVEFIFHFPWEGAVGVGGNGDGIYNENNTLPIEHGKHPLIFPVKSHHVIKSWLCASDVIIGSASSLLSIFILAHTIIV